jgi:SAM-dependent methyltransferase
MTTALLGEASLAGADVVEFAPGLGRTAGQILAAGPASYVGVDQDPDAVRRVNAIVEGRGECKLADAAATGLPDESADVVVGEAMLTMQTDRGKAAILAEAVRLLRPGGRYAIHELSLRPDDIDPEVAVAIRRELAKTIKVNARPLSVAEWRALLGQAGLVIGSVRTAEMRLLSLRRNLVDEGPLGLARIVSNLVRQPDARRRVLQMRRTFSAHRDALAAVAIVARKPTTDKPTTEENR